MKIVVFGATGRTGRLLVEGALERGHDVTALIRAPDKLGALRERLRIVQGDVLDGGAVSDAVDGAEAAIVTLADTPDSRGPAQAAAQGTLNVVRSMQRYSVRRLVVLSSASVAPPGEPGHPGLFARLLDPGSRNGAVADLRRMEISVRQSELDWTLVRAAPLVDGPARGAYRGEPGYSLLGGAKIARADVAAFLLDELERRSNIGHALAVAY
jgi:putative NADH-flavin reductase